MLLLMEALLPVQLKDDNVEVTGHMGDQQLIAPKTFRGHAGIILPLVQTERAADGGTGPRQACLAFVHEF